MDRRSSVRSDYSSGGGHAHHNITPRTSGGNPRPSGGDPFRPDGSAAGLDMLGRRWVATLFLYGLCSLYANRPLCCFGRMGGTASKCVDR